MRFVGLAIVFLSIPFLILMFREQPQLRRYFYFALGFLPFVLTAWNLDAALISWRMWPGHTKGLIVSLLDSVALAILVARPRAFFNLPFAKMIIAYILAAILSAAFSGNPQSTIFYAWQLCRMLLVFFAVANVCLDKDGPRMMIAGLVCGIVLQAGYVANQKLTGVLQPGGTLGHQNLLGMATHFVLYPSLALMMASRKAKFPILGVMAGLLVVAFGASRATIGLTGIGIVLMLTLSMMRKPSGRKTKVMMAGLVALALASPLAIMSLEKRFSVEGNLQSNSAEREAFEKTAVLMWSDHPMGVGANQYVIISNAGGYSQEAGVIWNYGSRSAHVHNVYLLVLAETGFIGLAILALLMTVPIVSAFRFAGQDREDPRGDIALGAGVTLTIVALHSFYEWVWVTATIQYEMAICLGIIAGLILQRKLEHRAALQERRKAAAREVGEPAPARGQVLAIDR